MLIEDLRDAVRGLAKTPRFFAVATLTLALGIGAVTAIYSVAIQALVPLTRIAPGGIGLVLGAAGVSPMEAMRGD